MPDARTEATEIGTALGMLDVPIAQGVLPLRPAELVNVSDEVWQRFHASLAGDVLRPVIEVAWGNGRAFRLANDGLRGRPPRVVEWKGPHKPPGYERLPADLRIDHVYLVSCKYASRILWNVAPGFLLDRCLEGRRDGPRADWFEVVAADAYDAFYGEVRHHLDGLVLPALRQGLTPADRELIKDHCGTQWPASLQAPAKAFMGVVAAASAERWLAAMPTKATELHMLWQLLRLNAAPYFVLGTSKSGAAMRLRVGTPWDWNHGFELRSFLVEAADVQQAQLAWAAVVRDRQTREERRIEGHVELRWSHGRFCGFPEAKVHLDTPHQAVPGYYPLV